MKQSKLLKLVPRDNINRCPYPMDVHWPMDRDGLRVSHCNSGRILRFIDHKYTKTTKAILIGCELVPSNWVTGLDDILQVYLNEYGLDKPITMYTQQFNSMQGMPFGERISILVKNDTI